MTTINRKLTTGIGVLHVALLLLLLSAGGHQAAARTYRGVAPAVANRRDHHQIAGCPRSVRPALSEEQRAAIDEWSNTVPATPLMEDKPVLMMTNENRMRYVIQHAETDPLSIVITPSCTPSSEGEIRWTVVYNETNILGNQNVQNQSSFLLSCASNGTYHVWIEKTSADVCAAEISYNTRNLVDLWPLLNRTALSPIKYHQHPRRHQYLIKWEKSKFDIHAMQYCLAISKDQPQRSLCRALSNSQLGSRCGMTNAEILQQIVIEEEKKVPVNAKTTIACTGPRTKQLVKGMKANTTYYLEVFAIHTQKNNLSYLLGATTIHVNRTRPMQLIEGKLSVGKLSTFGGLTLFSYKVPKKAPNDTSLKLLVTPCSGTVNLEIFRKKRPVVKPPIVDIYYPRVITIGHAVPGDRYVIQVSEADEHFRTNRVQVAATTKEEFSGLPQIPRNTTVMELTQLRTCHATTVAWYSSPDKRKIRYCTYVFKQHSKHQYYSNVKMPSYCELDSRDIYTHPQLQQVHCLFSDPSNHTAMSPMSMTISNLAPAHYYLVFVTASLGNGRSLPYRSARVKTHPFCRESTESTQQQLQQQQKLRTISSTKKHHLQQSAPRSNSGLSMLKGTTAVHKQQQPTERRNNRLKRDRD